MKQFLTSNKYQMDMITTSDTPITLCAVGSGAGSTYGLYLKALWWMMEYPEQDIAFMCKEYHALKVHFNQMADLVTTPIIGFRSSKQSMILTSPKGNKIKFTYDVESVRGLDKTLLLIDNVHHFNCTEVGKLKKMGFNNITMTTNPMHLATGVDGFDLFLLNSHTKLKLLEDICFDKTPSMYKKDVSVITDYTVFGNMTLMKDNPTYMSMLQSLNEKEKQQYLYGTWNVD